MTLHTYKFKKTWNQWSVKKIIYIELIFLFFTLKNCLYYKATCTKKLTCLKKLLALKKRFKRSKRGNHKKNGIRTFHILI
jgi:hypothetical protein